MNKIPFPSFYKAMPSKINDGYLFRCPKFCNRNFGQNPQCKVFYEKLTVGQPTTCPYGFAAFLIPEQNLIVTGLNVERYSPKKEIIKRIGKQDWCPCIPLPQFNATILFLTSSRDTIETVSENIKEQAAKLKQERELFEDTLHEIRKINNQLKESSDSLSRWMIDMQITEKYINDVQQNIYANSDLLSKRLNAFDILMNPENKANEMAVDFPVFKKMEKVYKCLYALRHDKNINVKLQGESRAVIKAKDILELAFYIIVENAFKYSPANQEVVVSFKETESKLEVRVQNWGLRIDNDEIDKLRERGYRGKQSIAFKNIHGTGLGLYVFDRICKNNDVDYKITIGDDKLAIEGWVYKPFIVQMIFNPIYKK